MGGLPRTPSTWTGTWQWAATPSPTPKILQSSLPRRRLSPKPSGPHEPHFHIRHRLPRPLAPPFPRASATPHALPTTLTSHCLHPWMEWRMSSIPHPNRRHGISLLCLGHRRRRTPCRTTQSRLQPSPEQLCRPRPSQHLLLSRRLLGRLDLLSLRSLQVKQRQLRTRLVPSPRLPLLLFMSG